MANDKISDTDRWNRGRKNANRGGTGAYTETYEEASRRKNLHDDKATDIDRAPRPTGPAGSGHYPAKDG